MVPIGGIGGIGGIPQCAYATEDPEINNNAITFFMFLSPDLSVKVTASVGSQCARSAAAAQLLVQRVGRVGAEPTRFRLASARAKLDPRAIGGPPRSRVFARWPS